MSKDEVVNNWLNNGNSKNHTSDDNYKIFNEFIFSNDKKILGKLLHRFQHFLNVKDLPGDIVEVGVFKGSGVATFMKFIEIFCNTSNKKVIGFDIFDFEEGRNILKKDTDTDQKSMGHVYSRVSTQDLSLTSVTGNLENTSISSDKFDLIKGDVEETLPKFISENPGFRIAMLYIDVDIERPTYNALKYLWDRILPGGVIIFDEFEFHKYSESNGVEKFFKERGIVPELLSTNWPCPSAFIYKKGW